MSQDRVPYRCNRYPNIGHSYETRKGSDGSWCHILPCGLCRSYTQFQGVPPLGSCDIGASKFTPDCSNCKCKFICLTDDVVNNIQNDELRKQIIEVWERNA